MNTLADFFAQLSSFLWGWPMIILLLGTHLFLTIRLKFPQRKIFTALRLSVKKDKGATGDVSQFAALATSLAATIGTGNIVGVATAVAMGGPGAVFWCWLTGVFGIATKYSEGLLAIKYRVRTRHGRMLGGPMFALDKGLGLKWLAILFCVFTAIAALGIGNSVQSNSIAELLHQTYNVPNYISGLVMTVLVASVLLFGIKGVAKVSSMLVPFMAIFYLLGCGYILVINHAFLWPSLKLIVSAAFTLQAAAGGFAGSTIMLAARYGIARGLFSNESGLGSAPIVAAAAQTRNPVRQALVSSTGTFWDTVIICAITGITLVSSTLANSDITVSGSGVLTQAAFAKIPHYGSLVLTVSIVVFAFTTLIGWSYYGERAMEYLGGHRMIWPYRVVWVLCVFLGSVMNLTVVWNLSDCMNALMAIPNLISLLLLSPVLIKETNRYLWHGSLEDDAEEDL